MMINNRRNFLKGTGLLGAFGAGLVAPVIVERVREVHIQAQTPKAPPEDISHLAPENNQHFVLMGNPKPVETPQTTGNGFYIMPTNREYQNQVELSVGKDNMLWLKVGDEWKRVLTT